MSPSSSKDLNRPADRHMGNAIARSGRWVAMHGRPAERDIAQALGRSSGARNDAPLPSPITRLSKAILAEIFYCGHILPQEHLTPRPSICLVSRHWRDVAINTPSLWTRLVVKPSHSPEFVDEYLHRSKSNPLIVHLKEDVEFAARLAGNFRATLPLLALSAHRWRELIINVDHAHTLRLIMSFLRDLKAPLLEVVSITAWCADIHGTMDKMFTCGAPRLRKAYLGGITLSQCWIPTDNVTTFSMDTRDELEGGHLNKMLEALPSITDLFLQRSEGIFISRGIQTKITMSSLRRLVICARDRTKVATREGSAYLHHVLTEAISAPNLETLVIVGWGYQTLRHAFASVAAPPAKFPALMSLELWDSHSSAMTRDFLETLPSIKELSFIRSGDEGLNLLLDTGKGGSLLPHLHTLTYESEFLNFLVCSQDEDHHRISLLCKIMITRTNLGIPIQKLMLDSRLCTKYPHRIGQVQEYVQVEKNDNSDLEWP